jgi:general secretion pathway protein A
MHARNCIASIRHLSLDRPLEQDQTHYSVAYLVVPPKLTVNALIRLVMEEFVVKTSRSYAGCLQNFAAWLLAQHQAAVKPVVILDEAQNLTPTHLKLLHFLLNYETSREKLLQLVLFGQTQLAEKIERLPELKSRLYPAALTAFNRKDTEAMISFRWMVAGGTTFPFPAAAIDALFRTSLGLPRELVKLCDLSLLRTFQEKRTTVTVDDIATAARELDLET